MRLGYCCINTVLREREIFCSRTCRKDTFKKGGLQHAGNLALANCTDLLEILKWNEANDIKVFRVSSELFPWSSEYNLEQLPNIESIQSKLEEIGSFVLKHNHRLSFHPGPFNCLGSKSESVVRSTVKELNTAAEILDRIGIEQSPIGKINIHVGGAYGNPEEAASRFCDNFQLLSESAKRRLTVENDDKKSMFTVQMLYDMVYKRIGIPITFDGHHHILHSGNQSFSDAFLLAISTWKVKPAVHWSNSLSSSMLAAHSDYYSIEFPVSEDVDIMLECKAKEQGLLNYRKKFQSGVKYYDSSKPIFLDFI